MALPEWMSDLGTVLGIVSFAMDIGAIVIGRKAGKKVAEREEADRRQNNYSMTDGMTGQVPVKGRLHSDFMQWLMQPDKSPWNDIGLIGLSVFMVVFWWGYYSFVLVPVSLDNPIAVAMDKFTGPLTFYLAILLHVVAAIGLLLGVARLTYKNRR